MTSREKENRSIANEVTEFLNDHFANEKKLKYRCYMFCNAKFETEKELNEHCNGTIENGYTDGCEERWPGLKDHTKTVLLRNLMNIQINQTGNFSRFLKNGGI